MTVPPLFTLAEAFFVTVPVPPETPSHFPQPLTPGPPTPRPSSCVGPRLCGRPGSVSPFPAPSPLPAVPNTCRQKVPRGPVQTPVDTSRATISALEDRTSVSRGSSWVLWGGVTVSRSQESRSLSESTPTSQSIDGLLSVSHVRRLPSRGPQRDAHTCPSSDRRAPRPPSAPCGRYDTSPARVLVGTTVGVPGPYEE